jgi:two-component system chemotaxis response regulator CheB
MLILGPLPHMSRTTDRRGGRDDSLRVVVVDDSPFMRGLIADLLTDAGVTVAGEAGDGAEALSVVAETRPDVVTMDVEMPGMGGLEAVERLMDETPTPVLMLSAHTAEGAEVTFEALERGAVDFFAKPGGEVSTGVSRESDRLVEAVTSVANADLAAAARGLREGDRTGGPSVSPSSDTRRSAAGTTDSSGGETVDVDAPLTVVIGSSTGGPNAVERVMSALPMTDCRVVIVQHMPPVFTTQLALRLNQCCAISVSEAAEGDCLEPGGAWIAPGGQQAVGFLQGTGDRWEGLRIRPEQRDHCLGVCPGLGRLKSE